MTTCEQKTGISVIVGAIELDKKELLPVNQILPVTVEFESVVGSLWFVLHANFNVHPWYTAEITFEPQIIEVATVFHKDFLKAYHKHILTMKKGTSFPLIQLVMGLCMKIKYQLLVTNSHHHHPKYRY